MGKKARKTIKYTLFAVLFALFFTSVTVFLATAFRAREDNYVPFSQKVVVSVKEEAQHSVSSDETPYVSSINVMLQYAETFTCEHVQINSEEELEAHRAELKAFYSVRNAQIIGDLDLSDCVSATYSHYGPFIEYRYESAEDFFARDYAVLERSDSEVLEKVYVEECDFFDDATRNSGRNNYAFTDALNDIGISDKQFTGKGVKIGIVESGVPNNIVNLTEGAYETYGSTLTAHSFQTSSIIGANTGIATDARLYFAALSDYSFVSCCNWFIDNGVNLINRSNGGATGTYNSSAAYADYVVKETKITFVNSAGNSGDTNISSYPGTGVNVISVASTDWNKAISSYSSAGMQPNETVSLAKPTLAAPGGSISGIPNVGGAISGTSFSAPMVTGVVALLMEEFNELKFHPEMVMSLLSNTCNPAAGQTETWDHDAGFGIVNYARARANYKNTTLYDVPASASTGYRVRHWVYVPNGATVKANVSLLLNSKQKYDNSLLAVNYSKLRLSVMNNDTGNIVLTGNTISNISYITFSNTNTSAWFSLCVDLDSAKATAETELYALNYVIDNEAPSALYAQIYKNGTQTFSQGFDYSGTYDTGVYLNFGDVIKITKYSTANAVCNFALETDITVSSANGFKVGENSIVFKVGENLQIVLVVHADSLPPKLTLNGATYENGATVYLGGTANIGWILQCETEAATAQIVGAGENKTVNCRNSNGISLSGTANRTESYTVTLKDDFGKVSVFTVIVDRESPVATVYKTVGNVNVEVADYGETNSPFFVSFDKNDANAYYSLNGSNEIGYGGEILRADGTYVFRFVDAWGNTAYRTVYLDAVAPVLEIGLLFNGEFAQSLFTVTDGGDGEIPNRFVKSFSIANITDTDENGYVSVRHNGGTVIYSEKSLPVSFTEAGAYNIAACDSFGNGYSFELYVIGKEAEVAFTENGDALVIRITQSQTFDSVLVLEIRKDGELLDGVSAETLEYTFTSDGIYDVIVVDNVGRCLERIYEFRKPAPVGELVGVENGGIAARDVSFIYNSSRFTAVLKKNGSIIVTSEIGALNVHGDGDYEIIICYLSDSNNFATYSFTIDKSAPEITATATVYGSNEIIRFGSAHEISSENMRIFKSFTIASLSDSNDPVLEVAVNGELRRYFGGGNLPVFAEGGKYVVTVYDALNNTYSFAVTVAGLEPQITIAENGDNTAVTIGIDLTQTYVNIVDLQILRNSTPVDGVSANVLNYEFIADGEYSVTVRDNAGRETQQIYSFKKCAPQGMVEGVKQGGKTKGAVSFTYDTSVFFAEVYLNGILVSSDEGKTFSRISDCAVCESDNNETGVINLEKDGNYEVRLRYISDPDNYVVYNFAIDKSAPKILLSGCADGKTVSGNVRVHWQDTDVASAVYTLNGGAEKEFVNDCEFTAEGTYTVTLKDDVDNVSEAVFGIDKTAPEISAKAWVYGEEIQRNLSLNQTNCGEVRTLFCTRFEITDIFDACGICTVEIGHGSEITGFGNGEFIPAFTEAGAYDVIATDGLNNAYLFTVNVIGGRPAVTFKAAEDGTSFGVEVIAEIWGELISDVEVYKDGEKLETDNLVFEKDGEYTVSVHETFGRVSEAAFTFVKPLPQGTLSGVDDGGLTNASVAFNYGDKFTVEVEKDGLSIEVDSIGELIFTEDGEYTVTVIYKSDASSTRSYSFKIDTVPPQLKLSGVEEGGSGSAPVTISGLEAGTSIEVYKNGELVDYVEGEEISETGEYEVRLTDAAGNVSVYSFEIKESVSNVMIFSIAGAIGTVLIVAAVAAVIVIRKKSKRQ